MKSDQPIIIEEQHFIESQDKDQKTVSDNNEEERFFQIMDIVEDFDICTQSIKELHEDAMLSLAALKFENPFSSITPYGHRCQPAFRTVQISKDNEICTKIGCGQFSLKVDENDFFQYEEQEEIEKQFVQKYKERLQSSQRNPQLLKSFSNQQVLKRFNILNKQSQAISVTSKFQVLLEKILILAKQKQKMSQKLRKYEKKNLSQQKQSQ